MTALAPLAAAFVAHLRHTKGKFFSDATCYFFWTHYKKKKKPLKNTKHLTSNTKHRKQISKVTKILDSSLKTIPCTSKKKNNITVRGSKWQLNPCQQGGLGRGGSKTKWLHNPCRHGVPAHNSCTPHATHAPHAHVCNRPSLHNISCISCKMHVWCTSHTLSEHDCFKRLYQQL